jgi:glycosyltransferase involved in cell wall biosynthesis
MDRYKEKEQSKRLKVCYLLESFYPIIGGGETAGKLTTEGFVKQAINLTVVTRHTLRETACKEILFGAEVHRIGPSGGSLGTRRWAMTIRAFFWLLKERDRWDFVFVDGFRALGLPAVIVAKLLGKKVVFKPQNIGEMSGAFFNSKLGKIGLNHAHWLVRPFIALRNAVLFKANAFFPHTSDMRNELLQAGIPPEKIYLIPNPYDNNKFVPANHTEKLELRRKLSIKEDALVGIFTGRLVSWKGPQYLVRIWKEIARQDENLILLIVGPDGEEEADCSDEIREYIRENKLEKSIWMTGGVRNVEDYLRASDYFSFPSQSGEGCSIGTIEAMACGLPIVTTRATGIVDIVNEETALTVDPHDFEGFKKAMLKVLEDGDLRKTLGQAGAARAKELFSPEKITFQYVKILRELCNS